MTRGRAGTGSVDQLPSGRWRVRVTDSSGERKTLGTYATEEEANEVLAAALQKMADAELVPVGGMTVKAWGERWLAQRERLVRDSRTEANRWRKHVVTAHFGGWPLAAVTRRDVKEWVQSLLVKQAADKYRGKRRARKLSPLTVRDIVKVARIAFRDAMEEEFISTNPFDGVRLPRVARTEEPWTYLTPEEQVALLGATPEPERFMVAFAIGTGLRKGEQWSLRLTDLHLDDEHPHVIVRYGSKDGATKSGKIRRVSLFGIGLWGAAGWMASRRKYLTERQASGKVKVHRSPVVFPSRRGCVRDEYAVDGFSEWLKVAGIGRRVRWHDLRHTCASSLVAGWWGRPWRLEDVRDVLGHSSITVTERYAHLSMTVGKLAALEAHDAWSRGGHNMGQGSDMFHFTNDFLKRWPQVRLLPGAQRSNSPALPATSEPSREPSETVQRDRGVTAEGPAAFAAAFDAADAFAHRLDKVSP